MYYLNASVLYPDEFFPLSGASGTFKKERPKLYKQAKFFVLARQYGCGRAKGDALSRVRGSFDLMDGEFPMLTRLQRHYLDFANKHGYVETRDLSRANNNSIAVPESATSCVSTMSTTVDCKF